MEEKRVLKVLMIEDNPGDVVLVKEHLKKMSFEFELMHFMTGKDLSDFLDENQVLVASEQYTPHLIILDLNLPDDHGLEILEGLKNRNVFEDVPIVIFTSSKQKEDIVESYRKGCTVFLPKDFNEGEFKRVMEQLRATGRLGS